MTLFTLLRTISVSGPSVILPRRSSSMNPSITFSTTCNGIVTRLVFYQIRNLSVHCSRQRFGVHEGHGNTSHDLSRKKGQCSYRPCNLCRQTRGRRLIENPTGKTGKGSVATAAKHVTLILTLEGLRCEKEENGGC